jgi:hypothetical protein
VRQSSRVDTESHCAVQLSWQPDVRDYIEAFHARNRARGAWLKIGVMAVLGAVFAVTAFSLGRPGPAMFGVEVAVLLPLMVPMLTSVSTRALWKRHPAMHAPTRAAVSTAAITTDGPLVDMSSGRLVTGTISGDLASHSVAKVLETKRVFVVQLAGHRGKRFFVLAKRGLATPAELDAVRNALATQRPQAGATN